MARFLSSRLRGWLTASGHSTVRLLLLLLALRLPTLLFFFIVVSERNIAVLEFHTRAYTIDILDI